MKRTPERLIQIARTVNAVAVDNDEGRPGEFLAGLCAEMADCLEAHRRIALLLHKARRTQSSSSKAAAWAEYDAAAKELGL